MDYIEFDCTPFDEQCAQIGTDNYRKDANLECRAMIDQLHRMFGEPTNGNYLYRGSCPHDFGSYFEIRLYYKEWDEFCDQIEQHWPQYWDDEAIAFLKQHNYSLKVRENESTRNFF